MPILNDKHNKIKRRTKSLIFLLLCLTSFILLITLLYFFPPEFKFQISTFTFQPIYIFFPLLFIFIFSLITYLFKSKTHGILIASFFMTYLLFRFNNLTHPFFLVLL